MLISQSDSLSSQKDCKLLDVCVSHAEVIDKHVKYAIALCRELKDTGTCGAISMIYRGLKDFRSLQFMVIKLLKKRKAELGMDPKLLNVPSVDKPTVMKKSRKVSPAFIRSLDDYLKFLVQLPREITCHPEVSSFFRVREDDMDVLKESKTEETTNDLHNAFDISNPVSSDRYIALGDITDPGERELAISTGDELEVVQRSDTGWWLAVSSNGKSGWVPSSYLETDVGNYPFRPGCEEFHIVTQSYSQILEDELSLPEGAIVQVLERNDSGWWSARFGGTVGLVPGTNLHRVNTLKAKRAMNALGRTLNKVCPKMQAAARSIDLSLSSSSGISSSVDDLSSSSSSSRLASNGSSIRSSMEDVYAARWNEELNEEGEDIFISNYEIFQPSEIFSPRDASKRRSSTPAIQSPPPPMMNRLPRLSFDQVEGSLFSQSNKITPRIARMQRNCEEPRIWRTLALEALGHGFYEQN